jgi:NitT/TauT family transport system ATP-binding protein
MEDLTIDLPDERNQLDTRSSRRFAELRAHVYEQIQLAKHRKGGEPGMEAPGGRDAGDRLPTKAADAAY